MWAGLLLALVLQTGWGAPPPADTLEAAPPSVEGQLPLYAKNPESWRQLIGWLEEKVLPYGQMAAAGRLPMIYNEVAIKELAYRKMIELSDLGYPGSIKAIFFAADLEPSALSDAFARDYAFYKALVNREKGLENWAQFYLKKIDLEKQERFRYYQAVQAYADRDLPKAKDLLGSILGSENPERTLARRVQMVRMLARIYFEEKEYARSFEIYQKYLLQLPTVAAGDWLEAGWNLYYLHRYREALGYLYNLESEMAGREIRLEKFVLRGLIYHSLCNRESLERLLKSFEAEFLGTILAIKNGEPLRNSPLLQRLRTQKAEPYQDLLRVSKGLGAELAIVRNESGARGQLVRYVYDTELAQVTARLGRLEKEALSRAAEELILAHESLRFLGFEIVKAQVDPSKVFRSSEKAEPIFMESPEGQWFQLSWEQPGDYWWDEREKYWADVADECGF